VIAWYLRKRTDWALKVYIVNGGGGGYSPHKYWLRYTKALDRLMRWEAR
jgi:hypothetical protein